MTLITDRDNILQYQTRDIRLPFPNAQYTHSIFIPFRHNYNNMAPSKIKLTHWQLTHYKIYEQKTHTYKNTCISRQKTNIVYSTTQLVISFSLMRSTRTFIFSPFRHSNNNIQPSKIKLKHWQLTHYKIFKYMYRKPRHTRKNAKDKPSLQYNAISYIL